MAKIHYMRSDVSGYVAKTLCGITFFEVLDFTDREKDVTCKKCLKSLNQKK